MVYSDPNNTNSIVYQHTLLSYQLKTSHWNFSRAATLHLCNMADRGEKLQQPHCYHPFSDSRDTYLTKNHYENYSPKMVPTNPTGSWTILAPWTLLSGWVWYQDSYVCCCGESHDQCRYAQVDGKDKWRVSESFVSIAVVKIHSMKKIVLSYCYLVIMMTMEPNMFFLQSFCYQWFWIMLPKWCDIYLNVVIFT